MHIILVSDRLATTKTISVTWRHLITVAVLFSALVLSLSSALSYVSVRHAAEIRLPFLQELLRAINAEDTQRSKTFVRDNLNAMAVKLGEMQAQMTRLDSLGERLAGLAGIKLQELHPDTAAVAANKPGSGGPLIKAEALTEEEMRTALDTLSRQLETRSDTLALLESRLFEERIHKMMLPSTLPVASQWNASSYGWRMDPFTGERAMHEGVDFQADVGTPIIAAAAGVVVAAEVHPQYGNYVEIDHGQELTTRYAHASRLFVKPGEFVKRGQKVAEVGMTGRTTGPHLHFEVRYKGSSQNPNRFLQQAQENSRIVARR
jgi:murein DD-endopeptidase MepM/ murein hydrolase activator NlpD